uniref:glycosyltransferase family 4 protein n=1 Tax=Algoriphagus sp. TaxID=1872435 RepID=UPI0040470F4D
MIVYVSESLNSKKDGGSSLSGSDFLNLLCVKFNNVSVISNDLFKFQNSLWYGYELTKPKYIVSVKRSYQVQTFNFLRVLKKIIYFLIDLFKPSIVNLDKFYEPNGVNILFVNSWSSIYSSNKLKGMDKFHQVCIVRGNPESFIWQSFGKDKTQEVLSAASYLKNFNSLIYVSSIGMSAWASFLPDRINSFYLPNSINENEVNKIFNVSKNEVQFKNGIDHRKFNIVLVGSVQIRKGQDLLLVVIEDLIKLIPNIEIHIVGGISRTWGGDGIYEKLTNSEFKNYFKFHGHTERALEFIRSADVCLFTSRGEAFPRAVAEYMALGSAIVSSNVSGVPEMILHGENGFLYDINSPSDMNKFIYSLYLDSKLSERVSLNARKIYFEKFSKKTQIVKSSNIFSEIVKLSNLELQNNQL